VNVQYVKMTIDIISELTKIAKVERTPEEQAALVKLLAEKLPKGVVQEARKAVLAQEAKSDSPQGYAAFYELIHGFTSPKHVMEQVTLIHKSHGEGVGTVVFAARGFWKSVSLSVTFVAWRVGLEPHKTNVIVSANDDSAEKVTKAIAAIIEYHPEWKRAFPNVTPDTGRWSVEGFSVLDSSISREEWAKRQSGVIDPTIIGGGYKSSRLIGKHPSGCLIIDDIHDRDNASSERERKVVVDILVKTILKTVIKKDDKMDTWLIAVGTPWALDDAYYTMKNTGQYNFISVPAMTRSAEGEKDAVYIDGKNRDGVVFDDVVGWWKLNFPKYFGVKSVIKERADGKASFWQMIMLDLATSATGRMKYYEYPADQIGEGWIVVGGADPTNSDNESETGGSHFALAFIAKIPTGGAVVIDGVLERCSQLKAENYILAAQNRFSNWQFTAVEAVGGGLGFIQTLQRNANIRIVASGLKGISDAKVRSKKDRWLNDGAKWFEDGTVKISNADTPFLNALRRMFDKIHDLDPKTDYAFDAGDATYHALKSMPDVLQVQNFSFVKRERGRSPMVGIGAYSGYGR
jgi:hypothetical protein